jgi:hypothetical protein
MFNAWREKIDLSPEMPLRQNFINRLAENNWLGYALYQWPNLEDRLEIPNCDKMSREEVLRAIGDMFSECYFKPLGIKAPITIVLKCIADPMPKGEMAYDPITGEININVAKGQYGLPTALRKFNKNGETLNDRRNADPLDVILGLIEELSHKFDHEICKKYLRGEFSQQSPWNSYGRGMLPQFPDTPGTSLYDNGTYYSCNPVERRADNIQAEIFPVLAKAFDDAFQQDQVMAQLCAVEGRPWQLPKLSYLWGPTRCSV